MIFFIPLKHLFHYYHPIKYNKWYHHYLPCAHLHPRYSSCTRLFPLTHAVPSASPCVIAPSCTSLVPSCTPFPAVPPPPSPPFWTALFDASNVYEKPLATTKEKFNSKPCRRTELCTNAAKSYTFREQCWMHNAEEFSSWKLHVLFYFYFADQLWPHPSKTKQSFQWFSLNSSWFY